MRCSFRGGQNRAPTIDKDDEWASAKIRLAKTTDIRSAKGARLPLFAAFDTTDMQSFLVQTRVCQSCLYLTVDIDLVLLQGAPPVDPHAAILSTRVRDPARVHSFGPGTERLSPPLDYRSLARSNSPKRTECKVPTSWVFGTQTNAINPANISRRTEERELVFNYRIGIFH